MEKRRRNLGLLHATDVCFAGYIYSIRCYLWFKQPLKDIIHGAPWSGLKDNKVIMVRAAANVDSDLYWRQLYVVLCTVFPALLALRLSNSNNATMDNIYYYVHKATLAIENNADDLENPSLFTPR